MNILITDGETMPALAVVRSLGKRGCNIYVISTHSNAICSHSKYCIKFFIAPDPLVSLTRYSGFIASIVFEQRIDVIFPITEQSIYSLNRSRSIFSSNIIIVCASQDDMESVSNKVNLFHLARSLEIPIPGTIFIECNEDLTTEKALRLRFPVVIKPAFSKTQYSDTIITTGVMYATSKEDLLKLYETKPELRYPSLIQERIFGEGTGLFTLFDRDHHVALFSHRRILEKPPSGGVSVLSESVPLDIEMVDFAQILLSHVGWRGVAMVEFKRDSRDGRAKLMEINGRFWGSLQLAISCGMNFPALLLDYYLGQKPSHLLSHYVIGHRLKWLLGILDLLFIRFKLPESSLNLPPNAPNRWEIISNLLRYSKCTSSVFQRNDPLPLVSECTNYIKTCFGQSR